MKRTLAIVGVIGVAGVIGTFATHSFAGGRQCGWRGGPHAGSAMGSHHAGGFGHAQRMMGLMHQLDLTQQQKDRVRAVMKSRVGDGVDLMWSIAQAREELKRACCGPDADEKAVRSTAGRLGDAIGDAAVFKMKLHQEIKEVLTPQQVERFKELCALEYGKKGHRKAHGDSRHTVEPEQSR